MASSKSMFVLSLLLCSSAISANIYDTIAKTNLATLPASQVSIGSTSGERRFYEEMLEKLEEQRAGDRLKRRSLVFRLFADYEKKHPTNAGNVIDTTTWLDLEMLAGPRSAPGMYSGASLDRSVTEAGRATLFARLVQPTDDVAVLRERQAVVLKLVENEGLFEDLESIIKPLVVSENLLLSFWEEDVFATLIEQKKMSVPFLPALSEIVNKSPVVREFYSKLDLFELGSKQAALTAGGVLLSLYAGSQLLDKNANPMLKKGLGMLSLVTPSAAVPFAASMFVDDKISLGIISLIAGGACGFDAYNMQHHLRAKNIFDIAIQTKLMHVVRLLDGLRTISTTIARHKALCNALPAVAGIQGVIDGMANASSDCKKLLALLATDTFRGKASSLSYTGRVIAAYQLMLEQRDQFVVLLKALGEIDAHMSVARLYKEFEHEPVRFCFPTYNTESKDPSLTLKETWNPVLNRKKAVANNAQLGGEATRNIIITGPNAGGKSTYMKSVVLSAICAQSIGIAPAREMHLTPFGKIRTYLNITDDLAAGHSHFKAGVIRARQLLETLQALKPHELCLTVVDEVFNGTTFTEGQAAAYSFLKLMGSYEANVMLTSTHFPAICEMAGVMGSFANYRVTVNNKPGQKLSYPYTIEPGISPQVITLQILAEEGFDEHFLSDAQDCLNRLEKLN